MLSENKSSLTSLCEGSRTKRFLISSMSCGLFYLVIVFEAPLNASPTNLLVMISCLKNKSLSNSWLCIFPSASIVGILVVNNGCPIL
jgi:hypothetical protein